MFKLLPLVTVLSLLVRPDKACCLNSGEIEKCSFDVSLSLKKSGELGKSPEVLSDNLGIDRGTPCGDFDEIIDVGEAAAGNLGNPEEF